METEILHGIIILAAGNSSRLGEPKQLLKFQGKSLIRHVAEAALDVEGAIVTIVTGAQEQSIHKDLHELPVDFVHNPDWNHGMSSSITTGLNSLLLRFPNLESVIIAVSDQPFVSTSVFTQLLKTARQEAAGIVACTYDDTEGTPVLFSKDYFSALLSLSGAEGAKKLLKQNNHDLATIAFPMGKFDIDTRDDYDQLTRSL